MRSRRAPHRNARELRDRILVVAEGKNTEPQYVDRLNSYLRSKGSTTFVKTVGVGKDPLKVVKKAIELWEKSSAGEKFDHCVALVDVDAHASLPAAIELARQERVWLLISNVKFEVWLRWHVEDKASMLSGPKLDELMNGLKILEKKSLHNAFPIENVHQACSIARRVHPECAPGVCGPNPSSGLPCLVDLMS